MMMIIMIESTRRDQHLLLVITSNQRPQLQHFQQQHQHQPLPIYHYRHHHPHAEITFKIIFLFVTMTMYQYWHDVPMKFTAASSFLSVSKNTNNGYRYRTITPALNVNSSNNNNNNININNMNSNENIMDTRNRMKQYRSQRWVVLVDDESSIRDAVGQLLLNSGYQVTVCSDGKEALRAALWSQYGSPPTLLQRKNRKSDHTSEDEDDTLTVSSLSSGTSTTATTKLPLIPPKTIPDVIVTDVRMPVMDGLTLLEQIRSHPQLVQIPVILLTAKSMVQDRVAGYQAGADAYLPKPFDPDELLVLMDHYIQRHETLNDSNENAVVDLQRNVQDIKYLLMEQMSGATNHELHPSSPSAPRIVNTNVFFAPDERQVLHLLCAGKMNHEIAESMYLSTRRIEQLLTILFRKTNVKNRTELVRWAIATGNVQI